MFASRPCTRTTASGCTSVGAPGGLRNLLERLGDLTAAVDDAVEGRRDLSGRRGLLLDGRRDRHLVRAHLVGDLGDARDRGDGTARVRLDLRDTAADAVG